MTLVNYTYESKILPKALFHKPIKFIEYYNVQHPFTRCPAIQDFYKNVFIIPFPVDFYGEFKVEDTVKLVNTNLNIEVVEYFFQINSSNFSFQFKPFQIIYWSDEDCIVEAWGPQMSNLLNLAGSFNIKNWIRPVHPSYIIKGNTFTINMKKGDPWLFLKFNSEENIELVYNYDKAIVEDANKMANSPFFVTGLKKYFKKFAEIRPKKLTKNKYNKRKT